MSTPSSETTLLPEQPVATLDEYLALGGGEGLAAARRVGPEAVVDEVSRSGLRGRGGGGFPTGMKWRSVRQSTGRHYVVCNAAEGEPGTFKDRAILRYNPYQVIEGVAIAGAALGAEWFRSRGTETSPGTMVFTVMGDVASEGVYELEMGTPLRTLVEEFGGGVPGGDLKMIISGVANEVLLPSHLDTPMDFDAMST